MWCDSRGVAHANVICPVMLLGPALHFTALGPITSPDHALECFNIGIGRVSSSTPCFPFPILASVLVHPVAVALRHGA